MKMCLFKMDGLVGGLDRAITIAYEMKLTDFIFHGKHYIKFDGKYREEAE